jgi:hypothetical protein
MLRRFGIEKHRDGWGLFDQLGDLVEAFKTKADALEGGPLEKLVGAGTVRIHRENGQIEEERTIHYLMIRAARTAEWLTQRHQVPAARNAFPAADSNTLRMATHVEPTSQLRRTLSTPHSIGRHAHLFANVGQKLGSGRRRARLRQKHCICRHVLCTGSRIT